MTFMDLISLISLLLSVASFATSSVGKFAPYKREFMAVGYVLFGFVISRILYSYLPPGTVGISMQPRSFFWIVILCLMAIVVLVALKKEGTHQAMLTVMLFLLFISTYGKSVGLIDNFKLRDNELLSAVEINESSGDMDRAVEILGWMKEGRSKDEVKVIDARISLLKSRKAEKLSHPKSLQDSR